MGRPVVTDTTHLHGPLGLVRAASGDLISAQGDAVDPDPNQPSEKVGRRVLAHDSDPSVRRAVGAG